MKDKLERIKQRIKNNFKENKVMIILAILAWFFIVSFTLYSYGDTLGRISSGNEFSENVIELSNGTTLKAIIPIEENGEAVAIKFATYARKNSGTFDIRISGLDSKKVYVDKTVRVSSLQDNAFKSFGLGEKLDPNTDSKIEILLSSDCEENQGAGVYYSNLKAFENSTLTINDEVKEGDLSLRFLRQSEELSLFYHIVIGFVLVSFTLILLLVLLVRPRYEVLFTVIAIAFGLTFWLIITPMSVPDETIHYEYSFQLSNYIMGEKDHLLFDEEYQDYGAMAGHQNVSASYERFIKKINKPLSLENKQVKMKFDINESYITCFIPQALGITTARLLHWNMLRTFYLGRLFNLAFYVVCVYIAIKNTAVHKLLFGILATLPIFMQQAASFSYDCFINGLTFVIVSFLMKWMFGNEQIKRKDFIIAFIASVLIAPVKVVYGLFLFLYWFIPVESFGSKRNKIIGVLIITAPAIYELSILLFPLIFRILRKIYENVFVLAVYAETISGKSAPLSLQGETYTFSYVMAHPMEAIELILRTIRYGLKPWFYASFGRALSGNSLILPTYLVHSLLALLIASSLREEKGTVSPFFRIAVLMICAFGGLMMVGGMLVSWTEINQEVIEAYGGPIIQGIQGRYFSPFLPYLFLCLNNTKIKLTKKLDPILMFAFVVLVFEIVVYVLSYTFLS